MSELIRVRDRKKDVIRTITRQAYMAMGPKVYEKLGAVDATETGEGTVTKEGNVHRSVSAPVVRTQIKAEQEQAPEPEQAQEKQAEPVVEVVDIVKRRGRKPGSKNQISSNSTEDEK